MERVIIDADPGIDDTLAILLAAKSNYVDLLGVTVVAGNCGLKNAVRNTFKVLDMADKNHIPVYKGAKHSLKKRKINATYVHGKNGFGDLKYTPIKRKCSGNAVDYLIKQINDNPGEITIVAVGPLTNIALAIKKDINFAKNLKSLIIMGSAKGIGNVTSFAEFNFYQDPHAAKIVFDSEINDVIIFGLDVTKKLELKEKYENYLKNSDNRLANTIYEISRLGAKFDRECGFDGLVINDPLTIAYLIENNVVDLMSVDVDIITEGKMIGKSIIKMNDNGKFKAAYQVYEEKFWSILFETLFDEKTLDF